MAWGKTKAKLPLKIRRRMRVAQAMDYASRTRAMLQNIKDSSPCADCNKRYPYYVMEFDHRGSDKEYNIMGLTSSSRLYLLTELAKCDIVCANCHRTRTHRRSDLAKKVHPLHFDFKREHIVSIIPRNGKFLVRCFTCNCKFWSPASKVLWEIPYRQRIFCSIDCAIVNGLNHWFYRHKVQVEKRLGKRKFIELMKLHGVRGPGYWKRLKEFYHKSGLMKTTSKMYRKGIA